MHTDERPNHKDTAWEEVGKKRKKRSRKNSSRELPIDKVPEVVSEAVPEVVWEEGVGLSGQVLLRDLADQRDEEEELGECQA